VVFSICLIDSNIMHSVVRMMKLECAAKKAQVEPEVIRTIETELEGSLSILHTCDLSL